MESIYNLISKPGKESPPKSMYRSRYDPKAPLTGSTFGLHGTTVTNGKGINELKKTCVVSSTFGPRPTAIAANPSKFLRKGTRVEPKVGEKNVPKRKKNSSQSISSTLQKPPVPSRDDQPVLGLRTSHDFVTANAVNVILSSAPNQDKKNESFMQKENYGKIPEYLKKIKKDISREKEMIDRVVQEKLDENCDPVSEFSEMDQTERKELLQLLRKKWDDVNKNYQKICHRVTMETPGDIRRKESQEAELKQLEDDIDKLSKSGPLIIKNE